MMADKVDRQGKLDQLAAQFAQEKCPKQVADQVEFYRKMAEKDTKKAFFWAAVVPGFGHFPLRRRLEGLGFFLLELILTGSLLYFFCKSIAAIFTSEPHYWRAFLWCLGGAIVYRIVSLVRVILLANRIKSDAAYLLLRLACKPQKT